MNKMADLVYVWIEDDLWSWNLFIPIEHVQFVLNGEKLQRRNEAELRKKFPSEGVHYGDSVKVGDQVMEKQLEKHG